MSAVLNYGSIDRYNFYIEKRTSSGEKIFIKQSEDGLKIYRRNAEGETWLFKKYMIEGLPKMNLVPREFFERSLAVLARGNFDKIKFQGYLKGGGVLEACIATIDCGCVAKYDLIQEVVNQVMNNQIAPKENLDGFVNITITSIDKGWQTKERLAQAIGFLGQNGHLTAAQIEKFINIGIESIDKGWGSKFKCISAIADLVVAGQLTSAQESAFRAICNQSIIGNWESKDSCTEALNLMGL